MSDFLKRTTLFWVSQLCIIVGFSVVQSAQAYIGPGAGLTVIGTILALVAALFLAVVGFVWYPAKKILNRMKRTENSAEDSSAASGNKSEEG